jgi:hypothetical protein
MPTHFGIRAAGVEALPDQVINVSFGTNDVAPGYFAAAETSP